MGHEDWNRQSLTGAVPRRFRASGLLRDPSPECAIPATAGDSACHCSSFEPCLAQCPEFCQSLRSRTLAVHAWTAGCWAKAVLERRVATPTPVPVLSLHPCVYIVLRCERLDQRSRFHTFSSVPPVHSRAPTLFAIPLHQSPKPRCTATHSGSHTPPSWSDCRDQCGTARVLGNLWASAAHLCPCGGGGRERGGGPGVPLLFLDMAEEVLQPMSLYDPVTDVEVLEVFHDGALASLPSCQGPDPGRTGLDFSQDRGPPGLLLGPSKGTRPKGWCKAAAKAKRVTALSWRIRYPP